MQGAESGAFYRLRFPSGAWWTGEVYAECDLAVRGARTMHNTTAVEVWRTAHCGAGIYADTYVTLVLPNAERSLAEFTVIEV